MIWAKKSRRIHTYRKQAGNTVLSMTAPGMTVDPKVPRASLPAFHGKLQKDTNKFINFSVDLLKQTTLSEEIFVNITEPAAQAFFYIVA